MLSNNFTITFLVWQKTQSFDVCLESNQKIFFHCRMQTLQNVYFLQQYTLFLSGFAA